MKHLIFVAMKILGTVSSANATVSVPRCDSMIKLVGRLGIQRGRSIERFNMALDAFRKSDAAEGSPEIAQLESKYKSAEAENAQKLAECTTWYIFELIGRWPDICCC